MKLEVVDACPKPFSFLAATVKLYPVPTVNPEKV
jgi:hypothetical protein